MQNPHIDLSKTMKSGQRSSNENSLPAMGMLPERKKRGVSSRVWMWVTLIAFLTGSLGGYLTGVRAHEAEMANHAKTGEAEVAELLRQVNPPDGYTLDVAFADLGPQLLAAGAFRLTDFVEVYQQAGQPLNDEQIKILQDGSYTKVSFSQQNAYFLLNFFWALGLTNKNPILEEGPMVRDGRENAVNFASTGGWSLAARPVAELYSSVEIIKLTVQQQHRLEEVTQSVYRPCCDNPTYFPDCNHGMAMLGMLTLLAANDASVEKLFTAAKYANAYWYPSQTLELAQFFKENRKVDFTRANGRDLVGRNFSSLSGFRNMHQWLSENGLLRQAPGGGNSCGV